MSHNPSQKHNEHQTQNQTPREDAQAPQDFWGRAASIDALLGVPKAVIGVIHSLPLPGAPSYRGQSMEEVYRYAVQEARAYAEGGVDAVIVENASDLPFLKPDDISHETVTAMAVMTSRVREAVSLPVGISCLADGVVPALAIAKASGATFVRATQWVNAYIGNAGFVDARAPKAMRYRTDIAADDVHIFADVLVKHGSHAIVDDRSLAEHAHDLEWYGADAIIVTGTHTGAATPVEDVAEVKGATRLPVLVGSGANADNITTLFDHADGVIVGSAMKRGGQWWQPVDPAKVRRFMEQVPRVRQRL